MRNAHTVQGRQRLGAKRWSTGRSHVYVVVPAVIIYCANLAHSAGDHSVVGSESVTRAGWPAGMDRLPFRLCLSIVSLAGQQGYDTVLYSTMPIDYRQGWMDDCFNAWCRGPGRGGGNQAAGGRRACFIVARACSPVTKHLPSPSVIRSQQPPSQHLQFIRSSLRVLPVPGTAQHRTAKRSPACAAHRGCPSAACVINDSRVLIKPCCDGPMQHTAMEAENRIWNEWSPGLSSLLPLQLASPPQEKRAHTVRGGR